MPNTIRDIRTIDTTPFPYIFEQNVSVPLKLKNGLIWCNVYRPKAEADARFPVIVTYGPYGKDIHYEAFHPKSYAEVNPEHHSAHSAWETPDPAFWTKHGYAVVRADELDLGQLPGVLDTMSRSTSEAFFDLVKWAAEQSWSSGKVGLLDISYYAGSQWRVAARQPRDLAAIIPWEGMSDYYRDRCNTEAFSRTDSSSSGGTDRSSRTSTAVLTVKPGTGAQIPSKEISQRKNWPRTDRTSQGTMRPTNSAMSRTTPRRNTTWETSRFPCSALRTGEASVSMSGAMSKAGPGLVLSVSFCASSPAVMTCPSTTTKRLRSREAFWMHFSRVKTATDGLLDS